MGIPWVQKHHGKTPGVSVSSPAMVVGLGTADDVAQGVTEPKNADVLHV
jgi:hypothetical protein